MAKLNLSDLANLVNQSSAVTTINSNNAATEAAMEKTLSRDGTSPNQMQASLDMNSNRIINLPAPGSDTDPARLADVPTIFVQANEPATTEAENSIWIDSDSAANDVYQLIDEVWEDTGMDLIGPEGPAGPSGGISPAGSSTDNAVARWNGVNGDDLQNSVVTISDLGAVAGVTTLNTHTVPGGTGTIALTTTITAGAGLTGGGTTAADRTIAVGAGTGITVNADDVALDTLHARNVDHSGVTLTAGAGLTGGGTIEASRSFAVGAGTGITVNADDVALDTANTRNVDHAGVTITAGAGLTGGGTIESTRTLDVGAGTGITVNANDVALDTANTRNVDHASVTLTAGTGLSGGGTLEASRTFDVDLSDFVSDTPVLSDTFVFYDVSGSDSNKATLTVLNGILDHDALVNFVADEHVAHTGVTLTAGAGLTGGGDISASRSFAVGAGTGITVNADDVALDTANTRNVDHASVTLTAGTGLSGGGTIEASRTFNLDLSDLTADTPVLADSFAFYDADGLDTNKATLTTLNGILDHDALLGFVANEHIDHTSVTLTAGNGLSGGGTIAANRTFDLDLSDLTSDTPVLADTIAFYDVSGSDTNKATLTTVNSILDHDALVNFVADEHVAHTGVTLTAGNGLTGGGDISANRTFTVGAGTGITVNADDVALNVNGLTEDTAPANSADFVPTYDTSAATHKKVKLSNLFREKLLAARTYYVRTTPVAASSITIASPGVVTSNSHGLSNDDPVVLSILPYKSSITVTIASPGVVTWTAHGFAAGQPVKFDTTGALPTGITAGTTYYVIATGLATDTFQFSTTVGGAAVNTSGTQSGSHFGSKTGTMPTGLVEGTVYYARSVTTNTFQLSATAGGSSINTTGSTEGTIYWNTGKDTNTGLTNSASGSFLTIQKALDTAATLDLNGYQLTIDLGDSTYAGSQIGIPNLVGGAQYNSFVITGNTTYPANVVISHSAADTVSVGNMSRLYIEGVKIICSYGDGTGLSAVNGGEIYYRLCDFGDCGLRQVAAFGPGAKVYYDGNYEISGDAQRHFFAGGGAQISTSFGGNYDIKLLSAPAFTTFAEADTLGIIVVAGYGPDTFTGSATGARYTATLNGVIQTYGGGASYLPGNSAGSTATGGQYA